MSKHVYKQGYAINRELRNHKAGHRSFVMWFTGLSGSGKSTIANALERKLFDQGVHCYTLDGDNIRLGINKDLSFTPEDRKENLRRIGEVAKLMTDAGLVVLAAFISPLREDRQLLKEIIGEADFIEVFVNTSLATCEARDVKGLYAKARKGEIPNFTGISAPYEKPENPTIVIEEGETVANAVEKLLVYLKDSLFLND